MANALSPCPFVSLEPELRIASLLPRVQHWHGQNQNTIPVGRIGQRAVHRLRQGDFTVIWADRPLRDEDFRLILARAAVCTTDGHPGATDDHGNVLGFQLRHRRGQDKTIIGLMDLQWHGLWLL